MTEEKKSIGQNIRNYRLGKLMTQETLAEESGLSKSYIAKVESGQRKIDMGGLDKISAALGIPMEFMLQEESLKRTGTYENYAHPIMELLTGCTEQEQEIIFDTICHLKTV